MNKIILEIERRARAYSLPIITRKRADILLNCLVKNKCKKILEIGTLLGYSSILMAKQLPRDGQIITIEKDPQIAKQAKMNIIAAGLESSVVVFCGSAQEIIPTLNENFDLLFLDATKKEYLQYLKLAEPKLKPNAVVVSDNVGKFGNRMQNFLKYIRSNKQYQSKTYFIGDDAIEVSERTIAR